MHNWFNILGLTHQFEGFDLKSLVAFIPLTIGGRPVTIGEILAWEGQETSALILPHTAMDGRKYFRFTDELEDLVSRIESNDPLVDNAVHVFNQFFLKINSYLAQHDVDKDCKKSNKLVLCQWYREFSRDGSREIPCLENPPCKNKLLKVQVFPARHIMSPHLARRNRKRSASSTVSIDSDDILGDLPAPHPFFLLLRATNAWLDYLNVNNKWLEWSSFVKNCMANDGRLDDRRTSMDKARLALLPSCCDVSMYEPDCILCKAEVLIRRPEVFPGLTNHMLDRANMFVFTQATLTEEECERILMLRADPRLCCRRGARRKRTSSVSSAETLTKSSSADS